MPRSYEQIMKDRQSRPGFSTIYMNFVRDLSRRSTCKRLQVGCAIVTADFRSVLSIGYNGNFAGGPNDCDDPSTPGGCGCLHAEDNACIKCSAPPSVDKIVFLTHAPCIICAKRLLNLGGVSAVYYGDTYRSVEGIRLLVSQGVRVYDWLSVEPIGGNQ